MYDSSTDALSIVRINASAISTGMWKNSDIIIFAPMKNNRIIKVCLK